jgi:hypothetical protein
MIHVAFCSALDFVLVRVLKVVKGLEMTKDAFVRRNVPIGFFVIRRPMVRELGVCVCYMWLASRWRRL